MEKGRIACTPKREYDHRLRSLREHSPTGDHAHRMRDSGYRMAKVEASIGRRQLKRIHETLALRRRNAEVLDSAISAMPGIRPQHATPGMGDAWHHYSPVVDPEHLGRDYDKLTRRLRAQGIMTGPCYPGGMHQEPVFKQSYDTFRLPRMEVAGSRILSCSVHHQLSEDQCLRSLGRYRAHVAGPVAIGRWGLNRDRGH